MAKENAVGKLKEMAVGIGENNEEVIAEDATNGDTLKKNKMTGKYSFSRNYENMDKTKFPNLVI